MIRGKIAAAAVASLGLMLATTAVLAEDAKKAPPANAVGAAGKWDTTAMTAEAVPVALDDKQTALIKVVNKYFNELGSLKGTFVQTGPDKKRMKGKFYIKKPGRFRFDYALPSKQVIISDGEYLAIQDLDLNNEDRVALDQTPFRLFMRKDVDLIRDAKIVDVQEAEDLIVITVQDKSPDAPGRIRLFLGTKPGVEVKEWVTTDAQGLETRVEVADLSKADDVDAGLFKIEAVGLKKGTP